MKPLNPSSTLAEIVGSKALPRTEAVKKVWALIKKSSSNKGQKYTTSDPKLIKLLGKNFSMFDVAKQVSKNLK